MKSQSKARGNPAPKIVPAGRPDPRPLTVPSPENLPAPEEGLIDFQSLDAGLASYLEAEGAMGDTFTVSLYRFDAQVKTKKWLVHQWLDACPTQHDIGLQFGSGEYRLVIQVPESPKHGRLCQVFRVNIAQEYDAIREAKISRVESALPMNAQKSMMEMMNMISSFANAMKPLIQPPPPPTQSPEQLMGVYAMMSKIMEKSLMDNISLHKKVAETVAESRLPAAPDDDDDDGPAPADRILSMLLPYLEKFLPTILGGGLQGKAATAFVKSMPEYKQLSRDRETLKRVVAGVETKIGKEETSKLLKSLNLKTA